MSPIASRRFLRVVTLLAFLAPSVSFSQITIKEKVEIRPSVPQKSKGNLPSMKNFGQFFSPPVFFGGVLTLPSRLTLTGTISPLGSLGYNQQAYLDGSGFRLAWKTRSSGASGGIVNAGETPYTGNFEKGITPDVGLTLYDNSGWGSGGCTIMSSSASIQYQFEGALYYPDLHVSATATATGSIIPDYLFNHWDAWCSDMTVTGIDSTSIGYAPFDGTQTYYVKASGDTLFGDLYDPRGVPPSDGEVTIRVQAKGDYVYLSSYETFYIDATGEYEYRFYQTGHEITVPYKYQEDETTWLVPDVRLVYDHSHGTFSGLTDTVLVTVSGGGSSKTIPVVLTKDVTCAQVTFSPTTLAPGDTASLSFISQYGHPIDASAEFDVWIEEDRDSVGMLQSPTQNGRVLTITHGPITYIAPSSVDSSLRIHVGAFGYGYVGGGNEGRAPIDAVSLLKKGVKPAAIQSQKKVVTHRSVAELNRRLALSACGVPGEVEIDGSRIPSRIEVHASPAPLTSPWLATLRATLSDKNGDYRGDLSTANIEFTLGDEAKDFGGFGSDGGQLHLSALYADAKGGNVKASLAKKSYDGKFPFLISVKATATPPGSAYDEITLKGPHTIGEHFRQKDKTWDTNTYDHKGHGSIGSTGCTLTCMAMIAKGLGADIDPGLLNEKMIEKPIDQGFNSSGGVILGAMMSCAGIRIESVFTKGASYTKATIGAAQPMRDGIATIESLLAQGYLVMGQVKNMVVDSKDTTKRIPHAHTVLITGKVGSTYSILDPADPTSSSSERRTTLEAYQNSVYSIRAYKPKS